MQATEFEFRNRWWVIFGIFFAAFFSYFVDPVNSGSAIADWLAKRMGTTAGDNFYRLVFVIGGFLVVAAALLRTWGTSYLQADVMRDHRVHTDRLLADGPYRCVRNPLYLGNILMAVGLGFMASRIGFVILSVGVTVFVIRLLLREESELVRDQGEPYRLYCAAVPRLTPALAPRVPPAGNKPQWGQAFRAELMYWLMAVAMFVFAATLDIRFFWGIFAVAMGSAFFNKRPQAKPDTPPLKD